MKFERRDAMRAVVDTNVWISAILNPRGRPAEVVRAFESGMFTAVTSDPLIRELIEVLERPRFRNKYGVTRLDIDAIVEELRALAVVVGIPGTLRICRDPDDDAVIETAIAGEAAALVSRDEDLVRDPELLAALSAIDVQFLTVERFLNEIAVER